jgi:uncharacterized protein
MNKFLLLILVLAVALGWWMLGRRREGGPGGAGSARGASRSKPAAGEPATMVACNHCGVHLPQPEAQFDAAGRPYCSEAHRLAGPR